MLRGRLKKNMNKIIDNNDALIYNNEMKINTVTYCYYILNGENVFR